MWRSRFFKRREIACRHCGELVVHADSLEKLDQLRRLLGRPVTLSSAYRCGVHNALVGGAPLSMHKFARAFDVTLAGHSKSDVVAAAIEAGFTGLGVNYRTFVHVDTGRERRW